QSFDDDGSTEARLPLLSFYAQPRRRNPPRATRICRGAGKARRPISSVPLRYLNVDLRRRDRSASARGMRRRCLVLFEKLSQGSPAPRRTPTDLRSRRAVHPGRGVARVHEELHAWPETFGRRGKLGRARSVPVDYRRQPRNSHATYSKLDRESQGWKFTDSVPTRQHARSHGT